MAEQQSLLGEEPDVSGIVDAMSAGAAPEAAPAPAPDAGALPVDVAPADAPADGGFDLDALLAEIETGEQPPAETEAAGPGFNANDMADMIRQAKQAVRADEEPQADILSQRFQQIEGELQRIKAERDQLATQKIRDNITSTIDQAVGDEMSKLEIEPKSALGKAFLRAVSQNVMVAVAREQARTGNMGVDRKSIMQQVGTYTKLLHGMASEMAARNTAKERRAPAGGAKQPFTPSKSPGEMDDNEFDSAVMAAMRALSS